MVLTVAADYPGLRLGCVVDDKHGKYCATLKGAPGDAMTAPKDSDGKPIIEQLARWRV